MKKKIVGIFVCMLLIGISTVAVADWDEGDGHKMHWPQLPDSNGFDVYCTAGLSQWPWVVLADDWKCPETGWIKDIHFWGSWWGDHVGEIDHFVIGIAENIPEDPPQNPYSKPGETLVEWEIHDWIERGPYTGNQGWYWSFQQEWVPDDHQLYWQYNVFLDEEDWFWQDEGKIYWLFISAIVKEEPPDCLWGWKSTYEDLHFMDDAVWGIWYELYWIPLTYPSGLTMDLAFVITGGEPIPDLVCDGELRWTDIKPGITIHGDFQVGNDGDPGSFLNWEVESSPTWGSWSFTPSSGTGLAAGSWVTVQVDVVAPSQQNQKFTGNVTICNSDDPTDCCTIPVTLTTPKNKPFNFNYPLLSWLFERFPNVFPILRYLLGL